MMMKTPPSLYLYLPQKGGREGVGVDNEHGMHHQKVSVCMYVCMYV